MYDLFDTRVGTYYINIIYIPFSVAHSQVQQTVVMDRSSIIGTTLVAMIH